MDVDAEADRVARFLRRKEEAQAALETVRAAADALNAASKAAAEMGFQVEFRSVPRRDEGARYSEVLIFLS